MKGLGSERAWEQIVMLRIRRSFGLSTIGIKHVLIFIVQVRKLVHKSGTFKIDNSVNNARTKPSPGSDLYPTTRHWFPTPACAKRTNIGERERTVGGGGNRDTCFATRRLLREPKASGKQNEPLTTRNNAKAIYSVKAGSD